MPLALVADYLRAERAWLLGVTAKRSDALVLVGARRFNPADTKYAIIVPDEI